MPTTVSKLPVFMAEKGDIPLGKDGLEIVLNNIANGITVQDRCGKLIYANDAVARETGFENAEDLINTPTEAVFEKFEILEEAGRSYDVKRLPGRRVFLGEKAPSDLICFRIKKTGELRWAQVKSRPIFDAGVKIRYAVNIFDDITDIKNAENKLNCQKLEYKSLFESNSDGIFSLDFSGIFLKANKACKKLSGYSPKELIGTKFTDYLVKDQAEKAWGQFFQVLRGKPVSFETTIKHRDGRTIEIEAKGLPVIADSKVAGIYTVARDITLQKKSNLRHVLLLELNDVLDFSVDFVATLKNTAKLITSYYADLCAIDLTESGKVRRFALVCTEGCSQKLSDKLGSYPLEPERVNKVLNSDRAEFDKSISKTRLESFAKNVSILPCMKKMQWGSVIILPLKVRNKTIGTISVYREKTKQPFEESDLNLSEEIARRVALAVDNDRLFKRELEAREEAETALEHLCKREQEVETLLTNFPYVVGRLDRNLRVSYVNPAIEKLTGMRPETLIGHHLESLSLSADFIKKTTKLVRKVINTGKKNNFPIRTYWYKRFEVLPFASGPRIFEKRPGCLSFSNCPGYHKPDCKSEKV